MEIVDEVVSSRAFEPDFPGRRNPWCPNKHPKQHYYINSIIQKVDAEQRRPPKYGDDVRLEVIRLRDMGYTLRQIADTAKVSKSTACLYLKKEGAKKTLVKQPGSAKVVETSYSLQEVDVGKITIKNEKKQKSN